MATENDDWESELWSYLSMGDGVHCPLYESCQLRLQGVWCLSDNEEYYQKKNELLDNDDFELNDDIEFNYFGCPKNSRIFRLVRRLAEHYKMEAGVTHPPVPENVITRAPDGLPIEVRRVPLKAYHGAVWQVNDSWVVHLNSQDTPAKQRFTLYHEIFHILAHGKATPVFKRRFSIKEGTFNELIADHFSACLLLDEMRLKALWPKVRDLGKMAAIFEVPKPVVYLGLRAHGLI
jgi:hypothetical protein